jgi:hypothetical protein
MAAHSLGSAEVRVGEILRRRGKTDKEISSPLFRLVRVRRSLEGIPHFFQAFMPRGWAKCTEHVAEDGFR